MLRECLPIIIFALAAIGGLSWAIMALRQSLARERRLARIDDLTGVRNARAFHEAAGAEIERARRYQHPFSVAVVDLGSRVGDRSEEHTSELQSHSDLVCRLLLEKKKKR